MGWALYSDFGTVTVLALSPWGAGEVVTLDSPSHAGTALGAVTGDPGLACRDEATLGISAATVNLEHTVLIMHHIARLTEAALLAGRWDFGTGILTVAIQISTGRLTCGKAVCVVAVGGTLKREFGTGTGVIIVLLAVSPWGTLEIPALDGPSHAVTGHRTVTGDPRPACGNEATLGVFAATLNSEHTLIVI